MHGICKDVCILDSRAGISYTEIRLVERRGKVNRYRVEVKEAGPLLGVLQRELPLLPRAAIRDALKRRDIKVNGMRAGENLKLKPGDQVDVYTPSNEAGVPVLYEDEDCLLVNKPAGLNTDDNFRAGASLLAWAREYARGAYEPLAVHRLDNATSGLVLLAKGARAEGVLAGLFKDRTVVKRYECLVFGCPEPRKAVKTAWLIKDAAAAKVKIFAGEKPGSRQIVTEYEVLEGGEVSRLLVILHTGRTHQIRAHLAFLGHPVLGDEVYGSREANREHRAKQLKLCATSLLFPEGCPLPGLAGKAFHITAPF